MKLGPGRGHRQQRVDFGEYLNGLYGYALALSRNRARAEDLVHETCVHALRDMGRVHAVGSVKSRLFTILRNLWLNHPERLTAPDTVAFDADGDPANERAAEPQRPLTGYANRVKPEHVRTAINQLPIEFREIIILREFENLSYQELAALLGCPPSTLMSRLARARRRLRDLLSTGLMPGPSELK